MPQKIDGVPVPNLSTFGSTVYGNSFAESHGPSIGDGTPRGDINSSDLNRTTLQDGVEFSTFDEIVKDFVMARLGHPVVRVELTPYQIKTCIDEAVTKMYYHAPLWTMQMTAFDASSGLNIYKIPPYILDNLEYVVYKKTLLSIQHQAGTLEFDFFIKYFQDNFLFQNFGVGDFYLLQQNLEIMRKVLGQEGSWNVINNNYLQIYPKPVVTPQPVVIVYRALDSNTMHPAYLNWIQRFSLAVAKGILGEIRGKYATLPSPGGGAMLNGQTLIQESAMEKEQLVQELLSEIEEPPAFTAF
tara:strand:+ start:663 stop:1559 length:897 start_codon:yes stop_codon:yes gene_type:complete